MPSHTSTEVYNTLTLPSLKDDMQRAAPAVQTYRATSVNDFDDFCKRDDMLFLRLGQGAERYRVGRIAGDDDCRSIGESDYEDSGMAVKHTNKSRMFPSFSPEPDSMEMRPQHCAREEQLGSSQRDVYDVSPPPGYKRLKRVRAAPCDADAYGNDENMTVTVAMNQLLFPPEGHISRLQHSQRRQIPKRQAHNTRSTYHHDVGSAVVPMGDGFSGDETQPQQKKTRQSARQRRTRPRAKPAAKPVSNKRTRRSRDASDSSGTGSNQSTSLFNNTLISAERDKEKRRRKDQPSLLGSLDVVSLSQEDLREAQQAATAALHSAEKSKDIATHVMPLRPMGAAVCKPKAVCLGLEEPEFSAEVQEVQVDEIVKDSQDNGDTAFDVDADGAATLTLLPSLRG